VTAPSRGEVWLADLDPTRANEQAGRRPVLIVSDDVFNHGPAGLVIVLPITSTLRKIRSHVHIPAPEGGLRNDSAVLCEAIRSVSKTRLSARWGSVSEATLAQIEDILRILLKI